MHRKGPVIGAVLREREVQAKLAAQDRNVLKRIAAD
jgi:hypothetical protein